MIPSVMPTYSRLPVTFERGQGSWLIDTEGRRYLDLAAGIAVVSLGHANPELVAALTEQANKLWHVSNLYTISQQQNLAEMLTENSFADTVFFTNSGTEAAELAIKMARKHFANTGRHRILCFEGAFHGRSYGAISAAGSEKLTAGFAPLLPGFSQIPWNDPEAIAAAAAEPDVAAIMVEPIQGEGGIRGLSDNWLQNLRALCDRHGLLLILDEVQSGMGRTGKLFAHEWAGISPDIMMVAKGIGGGMPLGAVLATEAAAAEMGTGSHGSTYGGNPLACAIGCKVTEIITAPGFLEEVSHKAARLSQGLQALVDTYPEQLQELRGSGLMLGLKCKTPNAELVQACHAAQLLTVPAADNVVRLLPALTITDEDISEALTRLDQALHSLNA